MGIGEGENSSRVLVLLLGLPAAGKTSLARGLAATTRGDTSIVIVSYDEHLSLLSPSDGPFSSDLWRRNRDSCINLCKSQLSTQLSPGHCRQVVVVDDNMQFFSMRKEVYKLARDMQCAFVQVHVSSPLELCLQRNKTRKKSSQVPDSVIVKMKRVFDVPRPDIHPWEAATISLDMQKFPTDVTSISQVLDEILEKSCVPLLTEQTSGDSVRWRQLHGQLSNDMSIVHTYDTWSRNILSKTMKILGETEVEPPFLASVGIQLNMGRRLGLDTLRATERQGCEVMLERQQEQFVKQCNNAIGRDVLRV